MPQQNKFKNRITESVWEAAGDYTVDFQPDTEAGLRRLQQRMQADRPVAKQVTMRGRWLQVAAAAVITAIALFGIYNYTNSAPDFTTITAAAERTEVQLPDGTQVYLRDNATISYENGFAGDARNVRLEGEAFFDVAENPQKPFVIKAGESTVTVLGTSFLVNAEDTRTTVLVKTGKVAFQGDEDAEAVYLTKNMRSVFTEGDAQPVTTEKDSGNDLAWQSGYLNFRGAPLAQIISETSFACNKKIVLENTNLADCRYTDRIAVADKNPATALTAVLELTGMKISEKDGTYYLTGGKNSCK